MFKAWAREGPFSFSDCDQSCDYHEMATSRNLTGYSFPAVPSYLYNQKLDIAEGLLGEIVYLVILDS